MKTNKSRSMIGLLLPARLEVRYDRTFLIDLKSLESTAFQKVQQFVFGEFFQIIQLQDLHEFQTLGSSEILYRFTLDSYLISIEITGQIVKFLRILPKPNI
ncbi:MAG: cytotoxic translational repressor of toxin-antitoxin stability system [Phormidesmis sp. CAN_BIN36]|nr:cytotoxic translational repressor of toxin-antitoxin stability system [Phormidesmis sp. CAN_BIN36]